MASLSSSLSFLLVLLFMIKPSHESLHTHESHRLSKASTALQEWKHIISSDPRGFISNWNGLQVCNYTGIYCAPSPDDPLITIVAGIDLNGASIVGWLPEELGLLIDLAVFHISSNRFHGSLPKGLSSMNLLFELDISNNKFSGAFLEIVLNLPSLKFLDIRFNAFHGNVPSHLFDLQLDAIFINNNKFRFSLPESIRNSPASVIVIANNDLKGSHIPSIVAKMKDTLNEIIVSNSGLWGGLPEEIGDLVNVTVFDVSSNDFMGSLPESMEGMKSLEVLNVEKNKFSGEIPAGVFSLLRMKKFMYVGNFFSGEPLKCTNLPVKDDRKNCIMERPLQRSTHECRIDRLAVDC